MGGPDLVSMAEELARAASGVDKLEFALKQNAERLKNRDYAAFLNGSRVVAESMLRTLITKATGASPDEKAALDTLMQGAGKLVPKHVRDHLEGIRRHGNAGSHGHDNDLLSAGERSSRTDEQRAGAALFELAPLVHWFLEEHAGKEPVAAATLRPETGPALTTTKTEPLSAPNAAVPSKAAASEVTLSIEGPGGLSPPRRLALVVLLVIACVAGYQLLMDSSGGTVPNPGDRMTQSLDRAAVLRVIGAHQADVKRCVSQNKSELASRTKTLRITFRTPPSGRPTGVTVADASWARTKLAACVVAAIRGWSFPKYSGPEVPATTHPFNLAD